MSGDLALRSIHVMGFRSLRDVTLELTRLNVLIGPNGAGKSNLLSALRMVTLMRTESLRLWVAEEGGASALLFYGPSTTPDMSIELTFGAPEAAEGYRARLAYANSDSFVFAQESVWTERGLLVTERGLGVGHTESRLASTRVGGALWGGGEIGGTVDVSVSQIGYFHFHDTSRTSPLRKNSRMADAQYLRPDGSNLAAFLYRLKRSEDREGQAAWRVITGLVRRVIPFLKELDPELLGVGDPEARSARLRWVDERDHRFDVSDLSDGSLRALALITALAQPSTCRPLVIAIDEPELGLHPAALEVVCALISSVSVSHQVIVSTQSPAVLNYFEPEDVIVTERKDGATTLRRLVREDLASWLEDYSLSELYDKNVLGGRP